MKYFAQLDNNNIVLRINAVDEKDATDESNNINEEKGIDFLKSLFGQETKWAMCDDTGVFRKNFPAIGASFDEANDAFIQPKPYESWSLNTDTFQWQAPVPCPGEEHMHVWNEDTQSWSEID